MSTVRLNLTQSDFKRCAGSDIMSCKVLCFSGVNTMVQVLFSDNWCLECFITLWLILSPKVWAKLTSQHLFFANTETLNISGLPSQCSCVTHMQLLRIIFDSTTERMIGMQDLYYCFSRIDIRSRKKYYKCEKKQHACSPRKWTFTIPSNVVELG